MSSICRNCIMSEFVKGTSVLVSLPTLLYVGFAHRKNRLSLLQSNPTASADMKNFLSLQYEFLPVAICLIYGIVFYALKKKIPQDSQESRTNPKLLLAGFLTGLFLSFVGRFGMSLPTKMFGMSPGGAHMVHVVAPPLYVVIFGLHVSYFIKMI